jgi:hypothetical protein
MSLPSEVLAACQQVVGSPLQRALPVSGGDINEAYRLESARGQVFLKLNRTPQAQAMFEAEAQGLALLAAPGALAVPLVLGTGAAGLYAFLLLEYVHEGARGQDFWQAFGAGLAELHRTPQAGFGLDHDNFIGSLPQRNRPHPDWPSFYAAERLLPQLELARSQGLLQQGDEQLLAASASACPSFAPTSRPPSSTATSGAAISWRAALGSLSSSTPLPATPIARWTWPCRASSAASPPSFTAPTTRLTPWRPAWRSAWRSINCTTCWYMSICLGKAMCQGSGGF